MDDDNIPKRFGGKLEYDFGSEMMLGSAISERLTWLSEETNPSLPQGPIKWVEGEEGSRIAVAVGKTGGEARREKIAVLKARE